ncbi:hypothetical protein LY76DRAFT_414015 [Colletotrichum caudatum]|nr:hypothetical protein LY76DRAFT_414015 [Colletotrichum caudatum]
MSRALAYRKGTGPGIHLSRGGGGFKLELREPPPPQCNLDARQSDKRPPMACRETQFRVRQCGTVRCVAAPAVQSFIHSFIHSLFHSFILSFFHSFISLRHRHRATARSADLFLRSNQILFFLSLPPPRPFSCWFVLTFSPSHLFPPRSPRYPFRICRPATRTVSWTGTLPPLPPAKEPLRGPPSRIATCCATWAVTGTVPGAVSPAPSRQSVRTVTEDVLQGSSRPRETDERPRETGDRIGHCSPAPVSSAAPFPGLT